jgi:hypothetical protein
MGIPLDGPAWMLGDNQSIVTSSTIPHSTLSKRHNALAYHRVHEAIAYGIMNFVWIDGKDNVAYILSKYVGYQTAWPLLQPLLFWKGETNTSFSTATRALQWGVSAFGPSPGSKIIPRDSTESCCFAPLVSQELASMNISSETKRTENSVNDLSVNQPVENDTVVSAHATTREPETECNYETRKSQTLEGQWNIIGKRGKSMTSRDIDTKSSF